MGVQTPGDERARLTIIMPVHNEAAVIGRSLERILSQDPVPPFRLVVVANGCRDDTAAVVRSYALRAAAAGVDLVLVELERGNKSAALNEGDRLAQQGPRVYLDGDVLLGPNALQSIVRALDDSTVLLCAPAVHVAKPRSSVTRRYARVWQSTPAVQFDVIGCGLYAVSAEGRARWGPFPDIISDDKYVRLHFAPHERRVLTDCNFEIQMPEGLIELVRVRGRWCRGNNDLRTLFPHIAVREPSRIRRTAAALLKRLRLWADAAVFAGIFLLAEAVAVIHRKRGVSVWERAERARGVLANQGP